MNANDLLKNLNAPELSNPNFTNSFTQLISDINTNFKILAGAPFGVGGQGDSVVSYMEYLFVKSGNNILLTDIGYEVFKVLFPKAKWANIAENERKYETIKRIINAAYPLINNIEVLNMFDAKLAKLDGSPDGNVCEWAWCGTELIDGNHKPILPISLYQFYDQRANGLSSANDTSFEDMTASVFATLDEGGNVIYKSLSIYPKLYFDQSNKYWAWMINNERTGIKATGPQGTPGSAGSALLYDESEYTESEEGELKKYYLYGGAKRNEQYMIDNGILKEGSIRFRVVNTKEGGNIRSELYLDAYSIVGDIGAWNMSVQLFKTLDNWLIRNYFDEIYAREVSEDSPQTLRVLGLPIFRVEDYVIPDGGSIGYVKEGAQITGYHSIEPRRDNISGNEERNKLHIQPIKAEDLFNKDGYPKANTSIAESDIQILDYVNIYINKANDPIFANIKHDSFSILNSTLLDKYTKLNIDGIEVLNSNLKSNLSNKGLLVQLVGGYEGDIIQSNLTRHGLFVKSGLESSVYSAEGIRMMNTGNTPLPNTYNKISSNLLYIGTQQVGSGPFVPGNTSRGFYVTGNTDNTTKGKPYRTVLYDNVAKKTNTSTADGIEIKDNTNGNNVYANIKNDSFSILNSTLLDEYTKQTIGGIEVQSTHKSSKYKSNLSGGGLLVQLVNGYENGVVQSHLSRNGLIITNGLNNAYHYAESNIITDGTNTNTSQAGNILIEGTSDTNSIEIINGAFSNKSTAKSNIIEDADYTNTLKADSIEIKDGPFINISTTESNIIKEEDSKKYNTSTAGSNTITKGETTTVDGNTTTKESESNTSTVNNIKINKTISTTITPPHGSPFTSKTIITNTSTASNIEIKETKSSIQGSLRTNTNEIKIDKIKITNSVSNPISGGNPSTLEREIDIDSRKGMLVPIGGIIMWNYGIWNGNFNNYEDWNKGNMVGYVPCGYGIFSSESKIREFFDKYIKPYLSLLGKTGKDLELWKNNNPDYSNIFFEYDPSGGGFPKYRFNLINGVLIPDLSVGSSSSIMYAIRAF